MIDSGDRNGEPCGGVRLRESRSWVCFDQWEVPAAPMLRSPTTGWEGYVLCWCGRSGAEKAGHWIGGATWDCRGAVIPVSDTWRKNHGGSYLGHTFQLH